MGMHGAVAWVNYRYRVHLKRVVGGRGGFALGLFFHVNHLSRAKIQISKNQNVAVINQIRLDGPAAEGAPSQTRVIGGRQPRA